MNAKERNLLEKAINSRLERLETILTANKNQEQAVSDEDESVRLDELNHVAVDETLVNLARHEQTRLKANLEWLSTAEAGLCQQCETGIPIQRLLSVPTTRSCVNCAKDEQF